MLLKLNIEAISRTLRSIQPAHYLFRVESLSVLLNTDTEKYESGSFEVGGYKWWVYFKSSFCPFFFFFLLLLVIEVLLYLQEIVYLPKWE